ncbi:MAG: AAA family ATPase [Gammaproteobacteria bacterium]|nr:AAA family ATPase [Gammaproteobacteria bacterium]
MITLIANLKGGTGKSTVNFNLAIWLATHKQMTRLFDLDPQHTLTDVVDLRREEGYSPDLDLRQEYKHLNGNAGSDVDVLVDVGTADMVAMKYAVKVADRIVVPVTPSQADVWSTQRFLALIKKVCSRKKMPEVLGFVNRADTHLLVRETRETHQALELLPHIKPLKSRLYLRMDYRRSFSEGLAVFELSPSSKAAAEVHHLAEEIFG